MKKTVIVFAFCAFFFACNSGDDKPKDATADTTASKPEAPVEDHQKGLEMIAADNCTTCHKIEEKNIGPAYRDVAKKYPPTSANIDTLAMKVIHGGSGNWGTVPMAGHPNLSMDSAREMVKYILSLEKH